MRFCEPGRSWVIIGELVCVISRMGEVGYHFAMVGEVGVRLLR